VPAVNPACAFIADCSELCGSTLLVFTGTLRPFTSSEASSTLSGPDLRGFAREEVIVPNVFVPASFASKLLPTTLCELITLMVCTLSTVPAGTVTAKQFAATRPVRIGMRRNSFLFLGCS
jgi:hypothetical protein